jgi:hypothetical protein
MVEEKGRCIQLVEDDPFKCSVIYGQYETVGILEELKFLFNAFMSLQVKMELCQ